MKTPRILATLGRTAVVPIMMAMVSPAIAQSVKTFPTVPKNPPLAIWKNSDLFGIPKVYPGEETGLKGTDEVKPIFYDGVDLQGKPTRVFAWLGIPKGGGSKVPGIVLVHGGGGTAFRDWVQIWVNRGYAAIAMDLNGEIPAKAEGPVAEKVPNKYYPKPLPKGFKDLGEPLPDTLFYHDVAAVTRGQSVLAAQSKVDPNKIGLTGSSWGGVLTILGMGVDKRFKFAAPVYGCGFLGENSSWLFSIMQGLPSGQAEKWVELWDPGQYVGRQTTSVLFLNGTNDLHFRPDSWAKTYGLAKGPVTLCMRVNWGHGHYPDADPKEITVFADSIVKGGDPLATITEHGVENGEAWAKYKDTPKAQIVKAELNYTADEGPWEKRRWVVTPAEVSRESNQVSAKVPDGATCYYFNIVDSRGCIVSSPLTIQEKKKPEPSAGGGDSVTDVKWGEAVTVASDEDVKTEGTPVVAYTFGNKGGSVATVNGVDFTIIGHEDSPLNPAGATGFVIDRPSALTGEPFALLSPEYQSILRRYWYGAQGADITFTIGDLQPGKNYLIQIWVQDSQEVHRGVSTTYTAGEEASPELDPNSTDKAGGVGQYVVGTFSTGPSDTSIELTTNAGGQINALQIRELP